LTILIFDQTRVDFRTGRRVAWDDDGGTSARVTTGTTGTTNTYGTSAVNIALEQILSSWMRPFPRGLERTVDGYLIDHEHVMLVDLKGWMLRARTTAEAAYTVLMKECGALVCLYFVFVFMMSLVSLCSIHVGCTRCVTLPVPTTI
jgi:hypothetical protein